jgi:hypothetical protein
MLAAILLASGQSSNTSLSEFECQLEDCEQGRLVELKDNKSKASLVSLDDRVITLAFIVLTSIYVDEACASPIGCVAYARQARINKVNKKSLQQSLHNARRRLINHHWKFHHGHRMHHRRKAFSTEKSLQSRHRSPQQDQRHKPSRQGCPRSLLSRLAQPKK